MTTISTYFNGLLLTGSFEERDGQFYEAPSSQLVGNIESELDDREELIERLADVPEYAPWAQLDTEDDLLLKLARDAWSDEFESELIFAWEHPLSRR